MRRCAKCRAARSAGWRCAGRSAAAISPTSARRIMCATAGNLTGDSFFQDADGYFHFAARSDDMIISAGYKHCRSRGGKRHCSPIPMSAKCAVNRCARRGARPDRAGACGAAGGCGGQRGKTVKRLQDHVKQVIAPYKYPRSIKFLDALPKTATGKIQRFQLRKAYQQ